jgi:hypothetical protein
MTLRVRQGTLSPGIPWQGPSAGPHRARAKGIRASAPDLAFQGPMALGEGTGGRAPCLA